MRRGFPLILNRTSDAQKRKSRRDTIITFNYDLVCEHALRRFGLAADYHQRGTRRLVSRIRSLSRFLRGLRRHFFNCL
jgi:hypothetical protein